MLTTRPKWSRHPESNFRPGRDLNRRPDWQFGRTLTRGKIRSWPPPGSFTVEFPPSTKNGCAKLGNILNWPLLQPNGGTICPPPCERDKSEQGKKWVRQC